MVAVAFLFSSALPFRINQLLEKFLMKKEWILGTCHLVFRVGCLTNQDNQPIEDNWTKELNQTLLSKKLKDIKASAQEFGFELTEIFRNFIVCVQMWLFLWPFRNPWTKKDVSNKFDTCKRISKWRSDKLVFSNFLFDDNVAISMQRSMFRIFGIFSKNLQVYQLHDVISTLGNDSFGYFSLLLNFLIYVVVVHTAMYFFILMTSSLLLLNFV